MTLLQREPVRRSCWTVMLVVAGALMAGPGGPDDGSGPSNKRVGIESVADRPRTRWDTGADEFFRKSATWSPVRIETRVIQATDAAAAPQAAPAAAPGQEFAADAAEYIKGVAQASMHPREEQFTTLAIGQDSEGNMYVASSKRGSFPPKTSQWLMDHYDGRYGPLHVVDNYDMVDNSPRSVANRHAEISMEQYVEAADHSTSSHGSTSSSPGNVTEAALGLAALSEPRTRTLAWVSPSKPCCGECARILRQRGVEIRGPIKADEAVSRHSSAPLIPGSGDINDPALELWASAMLLRGSRDFSVTAPETDTGHAPNAVDGTARSDARNIPVLASSSSADRAGPPERAEAAKDQTRDTSGKSRKRERPPEHDH